MSKSICEAYKANRNDELYRNRQENTAIFSRCGGSL